MHKLLADDEPATFSVAHDDGASPFVLICDHAGNRIPRALGDLGVSASERERHIAWDIGAARVASQLSERLDAFFIQQTYSRLVIDCNRPLDVAGSIVERSELTDIPGNHGIDDASRMLRARDIFHPYHDRIVRELNRRFEAKVPAILVSVHSFTPTYLGKSRPWHIGMLYGRDARVAKILLDRMRAEGEWNVGDNEPYAVTAITDYAIPVHGEGRNIPSIGLEMRQDLIADEKGQTAWAERIARWLSPLPRELGVDLSRG
ncbi:MAG TPA: N-formylglutamate amidohydrolase [Rudaea sp.]|jgi:predicted N-formylglutamate amidohydrolase|nr:N-formylglutamate amidohydrolase [Rudaea sp.]